MSDRVASLSILFGVDDPEDMRAVESREFAAFYRDEFGTVRFVAQPDGWWSDWFDAHPEAPAVLTDSAGRIEATE